MNRTRYQILALLALATGYTAQLGLAGEADRKTPDTATTTAAVPSPDPDLKTEMEKVSYIIGTQMGNSLKTQGVEVSLEALVRGIKDVLAGKEPAISKSEQQKIMAVFRQKHMAKIRAQKNKEAVQKLGQENMWKLSLKKPEKMTFDPDIPIKVAINEAVELAKLFGSESSRRFVNGALGTLATRHASKETQSEGK